MTVAQEVAGARSAHARLLNTLAGVGPGDVQQPSLLPGWNIAMLVTHLARNADSHSNVLEAAGRGEVARQYVSVEQREADIEAGRNRSTDAVLADLAGAIERLEAWWDVAGARGWVGQGIQTFGEVVPLADWPFHRWREVEVHHADLGLGFTVEDWDEGYVRRELEASLPYLPDRLPGRAAARLTAVDHDTEAWTVPTGANPTILVDAPRRNLVAWLLGRERNGFPELEPWQWRPRP
jgi:maleylpyruvate isomerase